jgi:hypothetical protein
MGRVFSFLFAVASAGALGYFLRGNAEPPPPESPPPVRPHVEQVDVWQRPVPPEQPPSIGGLAYARRDAFAAISRAVWPELLGYRQTSNSKAIDEMLVNGDVVSLDAKTELAVVETTNGVAKVRVLSGPFRGVRVWMGSEDLTTDTAKVSIESADDEKTGESMLSPGETFIVDRGAIGTAHEHLFPRVRELGAAKDTEGLATLILGGGAFLLSEGTSGRVIKIVQSPGRHPLAEVRILGPGHDENLGRIMFVSTGAISRFVQPDIPEPILSSDPPPEPAEKLNVMRDKLSRPAPVDAKPKVFVAPKPIDTPEQKAAAKLNLATQYMKKDRYETAREILSAIVKDWPETPFAKEAEAILKKISGRN